MRDVSPSFLEAVTGSHKIVTRASLLLGGQPVPGFDQLPITAGSVTLDRTAEIRGRCDVTITGPGYTPKTSLDPITPFGPEIQLYRGVQLLSGPELVSLGIFGLEDVSVADLGGTVQIAGFDRAQRVKDADFESTYVIAAGTNYADAIQALIDAGVPGLTYRFASVSAVTPLLVFADDTAGGRWAAAQQMATSIGCDLYFDGDGRCVLEPIPDPLTDPVVTFADGPTGVLVSAGKKWSRAGGYNAVIAYSSNPDSTAPPARSIARDLDPTSPTYYFGPYGKKPLHFASPLITSQDQADSAAPALLRQMLGVTQTLDLSVIPNPALEPGDVAAVRRKTLGVDEVDVLDSLVIAMDTSSAMTAGVRARQIAA